MDSLTSLVPEARFVCLTGGSKSSQSLIAAEFASIDVTELRPVTSIPAWIGERSIEGRWWFSGTSRHVAYASAWERDVLTFLDFSGDTIFVARDPAVVLPSRLDRSPPMRPWLIVESPSHVRTLLLPRSESQRSRELASILSGHAINVALFALPSVEEMRVVRWLAGCRFTRFTLPPPMSSAKCETPARRIAAFSKPFRQPPAASPTTNPQYARTSTRSCGVALSRSATHAPRFRT